MVINLIFVSNIHHAFGNYNYHIPTGDDAKLRPVNIHGISCYGRRCTVDMVETGICITIILVLICFIRILASDIVNLS